MNMFTMKPPHETIPWGWFKGFKISKMVDSDRLGLSWDRNNLFLSIHNPWGAPNLMGDQKQVQISLFLQPDSHLPRGLRIRIVI